MVLARTWFAGGRRRPYESVCELLNFFNFHPFIMESPAPPQNAALLIQQEAMRSQNEQMKRLKKLSEVLNSFENREPFELTEGEILRRCEEASGEECEPGTVYEARLVGMNIATISGLERMCKLRSLDLSCNMITRIKGVSALRSLKELRIAANRLSTVSGVSALAALEVLHLQHNQLRMQKGEGSELAKCKRLHTLSVSNNRVVSLEELGQLGSLTTLDVSHNGLSSLEGLSDKLGKLTTLVVSSNKLRTVDSCIRVCKNLEDFSAEDNLITTATSLSTLPKLSILRLDGNLLTAVIPPVFKKFKQLKDLYVARNKLDLKGLQNLEKVAPLLETLDVSENQIEGAGGEEAEMEGAPVLLDVVVKLNHLTELVVAGNPLVEEEGYQNRIIEALPELEVSLLAHLDLAQLQTPNCNPNPDASSPHQVLDGDLVADVRGTRASPSAVGASSSPPNSRPGTSSGRPGSAGGADVIPLVRPVSAKAGNDLKEVPLSDSHRALPPRYFVYVSLTLCLTGGDDFRRS